MERIAPSARLEAQIEKLLHGELATSAEKLAELGRLGARLVLQRAVEDEVTAFLGRARYQRTSQRGGWLAQRHAAENDRPPKASSAWPCPRSGRRGAIHQPRVPRYSQGDPHAAVGSADHRRLRARAVGS